MSHFAKVVDGTVKEVLVVEQDFINEGYLGDPSLWIQTSYNTRGNIHYGQDGNPDGGTALRGNYAGTGFIYDKDNDVFYEPQSHSSWVLNTSTWTWEAPIPQPQDGKDYYWDESSLSWKESIV
jgi:hypothetical protein